jgi:hypothetical protein
MAIPGVKFFYEIRRDIITFILSSINILHVPWIWIMRVNPLPASLAVKQESWDTY